MQYRQKFYGGPKDGEIRDLPNEHFRTIISRAHVEDGKARLAIYEFEESRESSGTTERVYRYRRTVNESDAKPIIEGGECF